MENSQIIAICVYKQNSSLKFEDLIVDFDQFDGSYDYNEDNFVIVGTDTNGKTWLLDFDENIVGESDSKFNSDQLLAEACNLDRALKIVDDLIIANIDFDYLGILFWDEFPATKIFS